MAQDKTEQVLIRVTPETKERWAQEADERGFRGVSGFVRFSVNNEIEGRTHNERDVGDVDIEGVVEAVEATIERESQGINQRLGAIQTAIESLQDDVSDEDSGTVATDLVIEQLPNATPYKEDENGKPVYKTEEELREQSETPEQVAAKIGVPTDPVRRTLEKLDLQSERIKSIEYGNGKRGYFADV